MIISSTLQQILTDVLFKNRLFNLSGSINPFDFQPNQSYSSNKHVNLNGVLIYDQGGQYPEPYNMSFEPVIPIVVKYSNSNIPLIYWEE